MHIRQLLERNRAWVSERTRRDPDFFRRQAATHRPRALYIGCSDARVPAEVMTGSEPGELFVHRNIANQVVATDNNLMAVVQYAIEALEVQDIIVCGHEECGGVRAALANRAPAHVDAWLANVRTVARLYETDLASEREESLRCLRLVELNVAEQVRNLSRLPVVQQAWQNGRRFAIHGWVYGMHDGLLRDLHASVQGPDDMVRVPASARTRGEEAQLMEMTG